MPWKYNPFTDALDQTGSGGASYINGVVADPTALPVTLGTPALDSVYLAKAGSGVWLINRKPAGLYCRVANNGNLNDWVALGAFPEVNADGNWELYNSADPTKELKFDLSGIATGTTRTITVPNKNVTLDDASDARTPTAHNHAASAITSGVLDNARINFAAPFAIGSTTPSTGAFTTLSANNGTLTASAPVLDLSQTWNNAAVTFVGASINITETAANVLSNIFEFRRGGVSRAHVRRDGQILADSLVVSGGAQHRWLAQVGGTYFQRDAVLSWSNDTTAATPSVTNDLVLRRDDAGVFAQRNLANPQAYRIYNTTDAGLTNFERGFMRWSSNVLQIGTEKAGTGSARALEFQTDGTTRFTLSTTGAATFTSTVTANGTSNGFETSSAPNGASPVRFSADSGNVLIQTALNPGITEIRGITATNPQTVRIFNTRTSSTNFERLNIRWASNECIIDAEAGSGGGTLRGIKIGSATTQPLGFWNATPAAQPAAVADATDAASTQARLNDLLARLRTIGIIAT